MKKGFAAGGVIALLIAGVAGCSQPESRSEASASVTIDGNTGSYWPGGEPANATFMNRTFTISGTASGVQTGSPIPGPVTFKIVARC